MENSIATQEEQRPEGEMADIGPNEYAGISVTKPTEITETVTEKLARPRRLQPNKPTYVLLHFYEITTKYEFCVELIDKIIPNEEDRVKDKKIEVNWQGSSGKGKRANKEAAGKYMVEVVGISESREELFDVMKIHRRKVEFDTDEEDDESNASDNGSDDRDAQAVLAQPSTSSSRGTGRGRGSRGRRGGSRAAPSKDPNNILEIMQPPSENVTSIIPANSVAVREALPVSEFVLSQPVRQQPTASFPSAAAIANATADPNNGPQQEVDPGSNVYMNRTFLRTVVADARQQITDSMKRYHNQEQLQNATNTQPKKRKKAPSMADLPNRVAYLMIKERYGQHILTLNYSGKAGKAKAPRRDIDAILAFSTTAGPLTESLCKIFHNVKRNTKSVKEFIEKTGRFAPGYVKKKQPTLQEVEVEVATSGFPRVNSNGADIASTGLTATPTSAPLTTTTVPNINISSQSAFHLPSANETQNLLPSNNMPTQHMNQNFNPLHFQNHFTRVMGQTSTTVHPNIPTNTFINTSAQQQQSLPTSQIHYGYHYGVPSSTTTSAMFTQGSPHINSIRQNSMHPSFIGPQQQQIGQTNSGHTLVERQPAENFVLQNNANNYPTTQSLATISDHYSPPNPQYVNTSPVYAGMQYNNTTTYKPGQNEENVPPKPVDGLPHPE